MKKLILLLVLSLSYVQAYSQCGSAISLACGASNVAGTTVGTTAAAHGSGCTMSNNGRWYTFVGDGQQTTITTTGTGGFDQEMAIMSGSCASLTNISCNDVGLSNGNESYTFTTVNGTNYYVYVAHYATGTTTGTFTISRTCTATPCSSATNLACGTTNLAGTTVGSTAFTNGTGCTMSNNGAWYTFVGNGQQTTISTTGTGGFDQEMAIVSGSCGSFTNISCNDAGGSNGTESYTFTTVNGTNYYVYVAHYASGTTTGTFTISRSCVAAPVSGCGSAAALACGTSNLAGTTVGTTAAVNGTGCTLSNNGQWYTFVGDGQQTTISSTGTGGFDQEMAIMSGSCASLTSVSCNDAGGSNGSESYTFTPVNGTTYYVYIAHYATGTTTGTYTISRSCGTPVSGCTSATNLPCGTSSLAGTTVGTTAAVHGTGCTLSNYGAWYSFAGNDQQTTINVLCGASFDAEIAVASGSCALLTNISCTDNQLSGANENVSFFANSGTTYYVYVAYYGAGGTAADTGPFTITRNCGAVVAPGGNQDCSNSIQLCSDQSFGGNSSGDGNTDLDATNEGCATENQSSWYFFSPVTAGTLAFTIQTTVDYDFAIWGPFNANTCPIATAPVRCSFAAEYGTTGLNTIAADVSEDASGDRWVSPLVVPASAIGKYYIMLIDNFWATSDPFTIDFNMTNGLTLNCTPLPIDLVSFLGYTKDKANYLKWITSGERENDYFIIEKSRDGENWYQFSIVDGNGTTSEESKYTFVDDEPEAIQNYYRLSQVDFNGVKKTYNTVVVDNASEKGQLVSRVNALGQAVPDSYRGLVFELYSDGTTVKRIN